MINVSKPFLPPVEVYNEYINGIWERQWLTNNGPLVQELEAKLKEYLGVKHLLFVNNGTIALQIAIKALELSGEIITTPFSYVATTNSILWEGAQPVFADVNGSDFNINPLCIEKMITPKTTAILATHVYGNPCDAEAIHKIAVKHQIKVIYDGAHAFDAKYQGAQILSLGDIATCSFHATKIFHTIEGGAIITNDDALAEKMTLYRQFGHIGDDYFSVGINGKNSEMHAAMGLCILPEMQRLIGERKRLTNLYDTELKVLQLRFPVPLAQTTPNYSYYPVVFESEAKLLFVKNHLFQNGINTRRYFYPSLNNLPHYKGEACPVSEDISKRVLALPLFYGLPDNDLIRICELIKACY